MEIHPKPHESGIHRRGTGEAGPVRTGAEELPAGREGHRETSAREADRVELSDRARLLERARAAGESEPSEDDSRRERLALLRSAYEAGELNTSGRIEQAARRMLGGS